MKLSISFLLIVTFLTGCQRSVKENKDFYSSSLFHDVQLNEIYPDSKTFVDCIPKKPLTEIVELYEREKGLPDFDLRQFVNVNFNEPVRPASDFVSDSLVSLEDHINRLWPVLTRKPDDKSQHTSLIPLPYSYIVPGGRFAEIYYWDSYFTMVGLEASGHYDMIRNMVNNFSFLIDSIGFIPNGNRNYYLGRSQPPFFSVMVKLLESNDSTVTGTYLEAMQKEYDFWMSGVTHLEKPGDTNDHVVMLEEGVILNRYWDRIAQPRPEAYKEDYNLAQKSGRNAEEIYSDLRAAAESGIDFSTRWFEPGKGIETIHTTQFIPVDLNCLLHHLEQMIAAGYSRRGNREKADLYAQKAAKRKQAILKYCWSEQSGFFYDYNYVTKKQSAIKTLAGPYPLFFEIVDDQVAAKVAQVLKNEFLQPGGLVTTLNNSGEQWDAPNGWAPLQWMAYKGLKNYNQDEVAHEIRNRWLKLNRRVFHSTGRMMEKYNVMDTTLLAGGGEYPNQDGFGWTNGIALVFSKESAADH